MIVFHKRSLYRSQYKTHKNEWIRMICLFEKLHTSSHIRMIRLKFNAFRWEWSYVQRENPMRIYISFFQFRKISSSMPIRMRYIFSRRRRCLLLLIFLLVFFFFFFFLCTAVRLRCKPRNVTLYVLCYYCTIAMQHSQCIMGLCMYQCVCFCVSTLDKKKKKLHTIFRFSDAKPN